MAAWLSEIWGASETGEGRPKLIGPDQNPCCTEWTEQFLGTLQGGLKPTSLDAFTYHNYDGHRADHAAGVLAGAQRRNSSVWMCADFAWPFYAMPRVPAELPTAAFLNRHIEKGEEFRQLVTAHSPQSELWLGEFASCAGSGVPGVSDSFESSLWYLPPANKYSCKSL